MGAALGKEPRQRWLSEHACYLAVFEHATDVQALAPDTTAVLGWASR